MKELLKSNIKKSLKIIADDNPKIPLELVEIVDEEPSASKLPSLIEELMKVAAQPIPWFYREANRELQSPQHSFFGFYALRNIIRSIFLSLRFIQAGDLLRKNDFLAASIFSFYSASFHLLSSFLSSHGRVIVDIVHGGPIKIIKHKKSGSGKISKSETAQYSSLDPTPEIVVAILTKNNEWKFEPRPRSHSRRWQELEPIFIETDYDVPDFFTSFFEYVLSYGYIRPSTTDPSSLVKEGIKRLTDIRHESIYSGYGADDFVHDGLINRDLDSSYGINLKSKAYRDFALGLFNHAVQDVMEMKNIISTDHWNEVQNLMVSSIHTPPFELGDFRLEDNKELNEKIEIIFIWLMGKILREKYGIKNGDLIMSESDNKSIERDGE
jgi:hypothetical protein